MKTYTSSDLKALLALRYAAPEYAFFIEVANGTGSHQSGYADGVAYSLYPSTGHPIYGFEIKVSRNDWLRELKQPSKAGNVMQYCDKWWLVAPKGVAKLEELPKTWGFLEIVNNRFYTRKHAPDLDPSPIHPSFIAALLRRATENSVPRSTLNSRIAKAREEAHAEYAEEIASAKNNLKEYQNKVSEWEKASGLKVFGSYGVSGKEIGEVVAWVIGGGLRRTMAYNTDAATKNLETILDELRKFSALHKDFPALPPEIIQHTRRALE